MSAIPTPVCTVPDATPKQVAIQVRVAKVLNLHKDRKDRTTKKYFDHETADAGHQDRWRAEPVKVTEEAP